MHNSTDYVTFLEKSWARFFKKSGKNLIEGAFLTVFGQNKAKYVKSRKSAWIGFLVLNVPYFKGKFRKNCWSGFRENGQKSQKSA